MYIFILFPLPYVFKCIISYCSHYQYYPLLSIQPILIITFHFPTGNFNYIVRIQRFMLAWLYLHIYIFGLYICSKFCKYFWKMKLSSSAMIFSDFSVSMNSSSTLEESQACTTRIILFLFLRSPTVCKPYQFFGNISMSFQCYLSPLVYILIVPHLSNCLFLNLQIQVLFLCTL